MRSRLPPAARGLKPILGARVLKRAEDASPGGDFQVYADPAGHPFCLCKVS